MRLSARQRPQVRGPDLPVRRRVQRHTELLVGGRFAGDPEQVARDVVRAMDRRRPMLYTPGMWALVMLVIRWLPRFVMRKIGF